MSTLQALAVGNIGTVYLKMWDSGTIHPSRHVKTAPNSEPPPPGVLDPSLRSRNLEKTGYMVGISDLDLPDGKVGRVLHLNEMANSNQYNKSGSPGSVLGVAITKREALIQHSTSNAS